MASIMLDDIRPTLEKLSLARYLDSNLKSIINGFKDKHASFIKQLVVKRSLSHWSCRLNSDVQFLHLWIFTTYKVD